MDILFGLPNMSLLLVSTLGTETSRRFQIAIMDVDLSWPQITTCVASLYKANSSNCCAYFRQYENSPWHLLSPYYLLIPDFPLFPPCISDSDQRQDKVYHNEAYYTISDWWLCAFTVVKSWHSDQWKSTNNIDEERQHLTKLQKLER